MDELAESRPQTEALVAALEAVTVDGRDQAAVQLAKRYAELLDEPGVPAKYRDPIRQISLAVNFAGNSGFDIEQADTAMAKIVAALSEQTVASDLGPKYLAALTSLGMTPAGRKEKGGEKNDPANPLDQLEQQREKRDARLRGDVA